MISKKLPKDSNLQTIIAHRTNHNPSEQFKQTNTIISIKARSAQNSAYASIGAEDPEISNIEKKNFLLQVKNSKLMDDDFYGKTKFKQQKFEETLFNADKPLPTREKIIEPEKININTNRINVLTEFNNL